jgi:hypothetical protein
MPAIIQNRLFFGNEDKPFERRNCEASSSCRRNFELSNERGGDLSFMVPLPAISVHFLAH